MRRLTRILGGILGSLIVISGVGLAAPAMAAPDPGLYPNVSDGSTVVTTITTPGGSKNTGFSVGTLNPGDARVLHGRFVNALSEDVCLFSSAQSSGYISGNGHFANLTVLESEGLPLPAGALPASGTTPLKRNYPISTETSAWECDFGVPIAAGDSFDYSLTVGVPLGGTAVTAATTLTLRVEVARQPPTSWDDADYNAGFLLGTHVVDASNPQTSWSIPRLISDLPAQSGDVALVSGRALGAYGRISNNLPYPIRVNYAGFQSNGTLSRFLVTNVTSWTNNIRLEPGELSPQFFMAIGTPMMEGNENRGTEATFAFGWTITQVNDPHTVTFHANTGTGLMAEQSSELPANLSANTFAKSGYTFGGWNTAANGSGQAFADGALHPFDADITLYAQWTALPVPYTVTFDANKGVGTMPTQTATAATRLSQNLFSYAGHTFTGWNTDPDGWGVNYADQAVFPFTAHTTLYAQWQLGNGTDPKDPGDNGTTGPNGSDHSSNTPAHNSLARTGSPAQGWLVTVSLLLLAGGIELCMMRRRRTAN